MSFLFSSSTSQKKDSTSSKRSSSSSSSLSNRSKRSHQRVSSSKQKQKAPSAHAPHLHRIQSKHLLNIKEYHDVARRKLPKMIYDYYKSGAEDEVTLKENTKAFRRLKLRPRVFRDVSKPSLKTSILNGSMEIDFPVIVAPTAMQRMAHADLGERATVRAATEMGTIMTLSTLSTTKIEDVANEVPKENRNLWFQLYVLKDREFTKSLIQRAEKSGYKALVVTVDAPRLGNRESDHHNKFHLPEGMSLENLFDALKKVKEEGKKVSDEGAKEESASTNEDQVSALNNYFVNQIDASLTWKDIEWIRSVTTLPIIVKGVITAEDAKIAVEYKCEGIVVSNHGARQLDTTISTIEALPEVVEAVKGSSTEVYIDGGIRRGTDVLKALALGAKAVLIGRPVLWGLSVDGTEGVKHVLKILKQELQLSMQLCGCQTLQDIDSSILFTNTSQYFSKL